MKVKIKKEGKTKQFKLISKWEDVTLEKWFKLIEFQKGTKSKEAEETIAALSDIPKKLIKQLELKDVAAIMSALSEMQHNQNSSLKNIIEIEGKKYGFHPDLSSITLGEWADLESLIKEDMEKNLPEIMAVLYREIAEETDSGIYSNTSRTDEEDVSRTSAKCIGFFLSFRDTIVSDFGIIFDSTAEGNEDAIATESFAEKWGYFGVFYRLCNADISKLEQITKLNLLEAFTWLSYETDLNTQNKVKYGNSK